MWIQGEAHVCLFKRVLLGKKKKKKEDFLPALYCIYTGTVQAHVFQRSRNFLTDFLQILSNTCRGKPSYSCNE